MLNKKVAVFAIPSDITDSEDKDLHIYPNTNNCFSNPSCGKLH